MINKQASEESIKSVKETIEFLRGMVNRSRAMQHGGSDAIKNAVEAVTEMEFDAGIKKDKHLSKCTDEDFIRARGYQAMQEAYQSIITLFSKPEILISKYEEEIKPYEAWLRKFDGNQGSDENKGA